MIERFFQIAEYGHEITLWILILLSIFSLAFILERFFTLSRVSKKSDETSEKIRDILKANQLDEIEDIAKDKDSIEGQALSYALRHLKEKGTEGLEEIFSSFALVEKPQLEKRLNFLATVGSNAPFIGLLGTVFGVMDAFKQLANAQPDQAMVMLGISKALIATAIGLAVAIPAVIAYNYFQRKVRGIMSSLNSTRDVCLAYARTRKGGN
ncbi:MAG TPA: tolQ protein [Bdellovibrionales bacterium]|nr:tolQ protein [Pseudobdellovibrionaceae bacterium]HAG92036.1 tolQ protein [Bdellovibrionales bacterium]|tara:strand:- start:592 stop:1221 length:630 start_codon:yes stop_codon:yes gene_type:complete